jgi:hypothetical protein
MTPDEDVYCQGLGRALIEKASSADSAFAAPAPLFDEQSPLEKMEWLDTKQTAGLSRDDLFHASRAIFARGRAINLLLNADQTVGLALVYQRWAALSADPALKSRRAEQFGQYYPGRSSHAARRPVAD